MTNADLRRVLGMLPAGASLTLSRDDLLCALGPAERSVENPDERTRVPEPAPTWREKLWTVPPETRLSVPEVAEAIGRPVSWVYRHTSEKSGLPRLPHRKLDGELAFVATDLRQWLRANEEVIEPSTRAPQTLELHVS